jgi:ferredoxin
VTRETPPDPPGKERGVWRVEVDRDRCMGSGGCVYAMSEVFAMGEDGVAKVIGPVNVGDEFVSDVVAECPTAALRLLRDGCDQAAGKLK